MLSHSETVIEVLSSKLGDLCPVPEFINLLRSPEIESQPGGPIRQPYDNQCRNFLTFKEPRNRFRQPV
jgi:hypothetical protein